MSFARCLIVEVNDKWGYIDKKGNWVIQPMFDFDYVEYYTEGLAEVRENHVIQLQKILNCHKPNKIATFKDATKEFIFMLAFISLSLLA